MAKYSAEQMRQMMAKGQAMKNPAGDPSFPIADEEDLHNAIRAVGRAGASGNAVRRYIMKRARAMGKSAMIPDTWAADGSLQSPTSASRAEPLESQFFQRCYALEDIHIQRTTDGRTVEAYAAPFDVAAEIRDGQGHYREVIDPKAFNKTLADARPQGARRNWSVGVFYNHASTVHGTPSERGSVPIGAVMDIRPDARGLLTVTRYNNTPLADDVLESIRNGDITGQSFTGRIVRSNPDQRRYLPSSTGGLTTVRRLELGLAEYGPTPMPAYKEAAIVSVRSLQEAAEDTPPGAVDLVGRREALIQRARELGVIQ